MIMDIEKTPARMKAYRDSIDGKSGIVIIGPFDTISNTILEYCREIIDEGSGEIVLDLGQATYMTSQGIACVIKALKLTQAANCRLTVRRASKDMTDLFCLARIDNRINLTD